MSTPNFYCQRVCGEVGFSIEEWNKAFRECIEMGYSEEQMDEILNPEYNPCKEQCQDCINIVLETQKKNRKTWDK